MITKENITLRMAIDERIMKSNIVPGLNLGGKYSADG
jgi:hypothetical protein